MTNKQLSQPPLLVFRGREVDADYNQQPLSIYRDNPLIEALPPILTEEEAMAQLMHHPRFDPAERFLPNHERLHLITEVLQFFQPLPVHTDLEQRFSRLIRSGYRARNPLTVGFWGDVNSRVESLRTDQSVPRRLRSTATGFTILGMSGVGKTTAVEETLLLYPQVINHSHYRNRDFTLRQIVWLKLDCPFDGSIKGLCLNFFQAVDELLKTSYSQNYASGRRTVDELIPKMARVASNQSLGVLVIDEIQNLSEAKSGGHRKMLNFFVQLINTIGLPVVLVGTYKAMSVLGSEFRQMRRGTGQGDLVWDPMAEDEVWQFFVESLWRYQYVRQPCPLTPELSHALYYETQGITDFAVKVYMLAQIRAITTLREKVTKAIIQSVAKDSLRLATPVLSALKSGNLKKLQDYEDVHPIDIELFLAEATEDRCETKLRSVRNDLVQEATAQSQPSSGGSKATFQETNSNAVSDTDSAQVTNRSKKRRLDTCASLELPEIVSIGANKGLSAYEAIRQAGYIRPATEFLDTRSRG